MSLFIRITCTETTLTSNLVAGIKMQLFHRVWHLWEVQKEILLILKSIDLNLHLLKCFQILDINLNSIHICLTCTYRLINTHNWLCFLIVSQTWHATLNQTSVFIAKLVASFQMLTYNTCCSILSEQIQTYLQIHFKWESTWRTCLFQVANLVTPMSIVSLVCNNQWMDPMFGIWGLLLCKTIISFLIRVTHIISISVLVLRTRHLTF